MPPVPESGRLVIKWTKSQFAEDNTGLLELHSTRNWSNMVPASLVVLAQGSGISHTLT